MADPHLRHIYEQEGLNTLGVWDYSDWDTLAAQITKSFEYAKQRCTAYPRFVVQRRLFPDFYEAYRRGMAGVRTSASPIWAPSPERRVTGRPTRCMSACANVRQ